MRSKYFNSAFFIALSITILSSFVTHRYLTFRNENSSVGGENFLYKTLRSLDQRYTDFIFQMRGLRPTKAPVALVAIDDDSIREVGRWPWNRDIMAQITKNLIDLGVAGIGFDVIQSEPDLDHPDLDEKLSEVIKTHSDQIVLGIFNENQEIFLPYQDYCVTQAFLENGGNNLVKLNPTLSMDEPEDPFDNLKWRNLFGTLFANARKLTEIRILKSLEKAESSQLTNYQLKYLEATQAKDLYQYCKTWLTPEDPFQWKESEPLRNLYESVFSSVKGFEGKPLEEILSNFKDDSPFNIVPQSIEWTPNIPIIQNEGLYSASFYAYIDSDGYVRRYPLFYRTGHKLGLSYIPSLALQTYLVGNKYRAEVNFERVNKVKRVKSVVIYNPQEDPEVQVAELPVDTMGRMKINYYGGQMALPYVSIKELLSDEPRMKVHRSRGKTATGQIQVENETVSKAEFFKGRSVIIGATAIGIYDLRNTPLDPNYPGPEIHLSMLANLSEAGWMLKQNNEVVFMTILLAISGVILSFAWAHLGALTSVLLFVGGIGSTVLFDYKVFSDRSLQTTNVLLLIEVILIYSTVMIFKYFTEEKKKKELKSTFSRYVSPAIVEEILQQPDNLKLGGRKQRMSVFFSDIRGFTTISEKLPPVELSQLLNDYLTPMTELVFKNKGTLDKYMGDAVMAFFGAPIFYENHAQMACRCALQSITKVNELKAEFRANNRPEIDIGIGINTGEMSVGNMGSTIVQNYTVMGDSVNLASRLEGINKEYGTKIIISEFTYGDVKDLFLCREVDRVRVKGKNEPVRIYELIKEEAPTPEEAEWLRQYEEGLVKYFARDFSAALALFENCQKLNESDLTSAVYVERCNEFLAVPPPEDWDGVFVMKTK